MKPTLPRALIPVLRRLDDGHFHSGQELAGEFGLSRASVCNLMSLAGDLGVRVHAVRGRGYRLPDAMTWLDVARVSQALAEYAPAFVVHIEEGVDSTNSRLMARAQAGAPEGTVVAVEYQLAGRGRRGRPWVAQLGGNLTFSVLWRFDGGLQAMNGLSLAVGLAVARAVKRSTVQPVGLKWPNDILVERRKLAGILIEAQGDMNEAAFAVVGVGLNVRLSPAQRLAIDQPVVDLVEIGASLDRNALLADCLREMHRAVAQFRTGGFAALRAAWAALDTYAGCAVCVHLADGQQFPGVAAGVDDSGAFLLRTPQGELRPFHGGEISLRLETAK